MTRLLTLLTTLLFALPAAADTTALFTAGTETDSDNCWTNEGSPGATTADDVTDTFAPPRAGRLESQGICTAKLDNFGITTGDVPTGSTIDGITVHLKVHGGEATQGVRRLYDLFVFDDTGICSGTRNDVQLPKSNEQADTFTVDDLADPLWGCTGWSVDDVTSSTFGIQINKTVTTGGNVIGVDYAWIKIVFTPPSSGRRRAIVVGKAMPEPRAEVVLAFAGGLP